MKKETSFFFLMQQSQTLRLLMALEVITSTQHKWYKIMIQNVALESRLARIVHCICNRENIVDSTSARLSKEHYILMDKSSEDYFFYTVKIRMGFLRCVSSHFLSRAMWEQSKTWSVDSFIWILQLIGQLDGKHVGGLHSYRCAGGRPQGRGFRRGYFNYCRWVYFAFGFSTQLSIAHVINYLGAQNHLPTIILIII